MSPASIESCLRNRCEILKSCFVRSTLAKCTMITLQSNQLDSRNCLHLKMPYSLFTALFIGLLVTVTGSSVAIADFSNRDKSIGTLPGGEIEYEMRVGATDVKCIGTSDYDDDFDQGLVILDAKVSFVESPEISTDPSRWLVVTVQTGVRWIGLIDRENGQINFESSKIVDITNKQVREKFGKLSTILKRDVVSGEYDSGAIQGSIKSIITIFPWLKNLVRCSGEGSFIMLRKN